MKPIIFPSHHFVVNTVRAASCYNVYAEEYKPGIAKHMNRVPRLQRYSFFSEHWYLYPCKLAPTYVEVDMLPPWKQFQQLPPWA